MRSLPLTDKTRAGGRPRRTRAPANPFAVWLADCGMTPEDVAAKLSKLTGKPLSVSSIYNSRNAYFKPGRALAVAIEHLTTDPTTQISACPVSTWEVVKARPRRAPRARAA